MSNTLTKEKYVQVSNAYVAKKANEAKEVYEKSNTGSLSYRRNTFDRFMRLQLTVKFVSSNG